MAVSSFWHFVLLAFLLVNLSKAQPSAPVPHLLTYADAVLAPAPGQEDYEAKTYSEGPGLDGVTGSNVTLLSYNATCTGFGPETRISGDGTYNGTGLFVGEGTFTSVAGSDPSTFVVANGTFLGDAICAGAGTISTDDPDTTLTVADEGTIDGNGTFHIPQGLFVGAGIFSGGDDLSFSDGSATLTGTGVLAGSGNASGVFSCNGSGELQGRGSFTGSGTFVGRGYYYASLPNDSADFLGTGLVDGYGNCATGDVVGLQNGALILPEVADIIDEGDEIYDDVETIQGAAMAAPGPAARASAGR